MRARILCISVQSKTRCAAYQFPYATDFRSRPSDPSYNATMMRRITLGLLAAGLLCGQTSTWRPVYLGMEGMVATAHYATAMAGYKMLAQGGPAPLLSPAGQALAGTPSF
jgi:hypothetical protein